MWGSIEWYTSEIIKEESPRLHAIITTSEPKLIGNNKITFELGTQSQIDLFNSELKNRTLSYLQDKLENNMIELEVILSLSAKKSTKPLSAKEKYEYLLSKNPNLDILKTDFDLDIL